jgi:hypothetical protein
VKLDWISTLQPAAPAPQVVDQRMTIIDALAVLADGVAYRQDAVHTEAWISRLRHQISARRLGRLVDYTMDEGGNARCFVHLEASGDAAPVEAERRARVARRHGLHQPPRWDRDPPSCGAGDPGRRACGV